MRENGYPLLADFGLSAIGKQVRDAECTEFCGTVDYLAPEMVKKLKYGKSIDFWAFGCFIYELLSGNPPFLSSSREETYDKILN